MTPKLKSLAYRDRKCVEALFTCTNRVGLRKGNAAGPRQTGVPALGGGDELVSVALALIKELLCPNPNRRIR